MIRCTLPDTRFSHRLHGSKRLLSAAAVIAAIGCIGVAAETPALLPVGDGLSARLGVGALHCYSASLEKGQLARIVVDQKGIDIVLSARSADGTKLAEVDAVTGTSGLESLLLGGTESTAISIEVRSLDGGSLGG